MHSCHQNSSSTKQGWVPPSPRHPCRQHDRQCDTGHRALSMTGRLQMKAQLKNPGHRGRNHEQMCNGRERVAFSRWGIHPQISGQLYRKAAGTEWGCIPGMSGQPCSSTEQSRMVCCGRLARKRHNGVGWHAGCVQGLQEALCEPRCRVLRCSCTCAALGL